MSNKEINIPKAIKKSVILTQFNDAREDNYYWMRLSDEQKNSADPDQQTKEVLAYLNQENDYTKQMMSKTESLQETLFDEITGRIKQTDMSVPFLYNKYFYITRFEERKEYPIYCRKFKSLDAPEEVLLDLNVLAEGYNYYNIAGRNISPNNKILAYGEDTVSRRIYTICFKNLITGELYKDIIENTTGSVTWANDNKTVFYTRKDKALRSYKIFKHVLGTDQNQDVEVYHEKDETFSCYVYKSRSKKYIIIGSWATLSQEYKILQADNPNGNFEIFQSRIPHLEYDIAHHEDRWYIKTNKDDAFNFKIMTTSEDKTDIQHWQEFLAHDKNIFIDDINVFKDFITLSIREAGNTMLKIITPDTNFHIPFDEDAYYVGISNNPEYVTQKLRLMYSSQTTPMTTYDFNIKSKRFTLLKQQEVVGSFDNKQYTSEKIMVEVRDKTKVPISIVYKKGFKKDGTGPILLYGYGSYGLSMDPYFSSVRLSLLDRGFAFAIAHVRGGQEMGRKWYDNGKFLHKKNTFTDFIDCGKQLLRSNYTSSKHLYAMGGSAGGLLMGAIMNMEPDLWNGVIAAVPFVDVLTTMLDESIPLTTGEFSEWGNPKDKTYYEYIKSYSPIDNIEAKNYPATLITTGYFDSQVQYWEPAKWIAKLRDLKTDDKLLLLNCNMEVGHGGASGRFAKYKETALEYAFLLLLEQNNKP